MSKWFLINTIILIFLIFKISTGVIATHTLLGGLALLLIIYNWMRHAVFSTIRSNISRKRKIKFAKLSKTLLPAHKWTGTTALLIALFHASFVVVYFGLQISNMKMITGLLSLFSLIGVVTFGWLRHIKTTVARRYIHWGLAYALIVFVTFHLIF